MNPVATCQNKKERAHTVSRKESFRENRQRTAEKAPRQTVTLMLNSSFCNTELIVLNTNMDVKLYAPKQTVKGQSELK